MAIKLKEVSRYILIGFYAFAGSYHFINPEFYFGLIPDYLSFPEFINYAAGIAEITLAVAIGFITSRPLAIKGLILMLLAFIPSHVYFIEIGACIEGSICVDPWVAWLRLLIVHPLLIFWAWKVKD